MTKRLTLTGVLSLLAMVGILGRIVLRKILVITVTADAGFGC